MSLLESFPSNQTSDPESLTLHYGWDEKLVDQLVEKSRQPHIEEMTPEDPEWKFRSPEKAAKWGNRSNTICAWLGTAAGELAGIAWIENAYKLSHPTGSRIFGVRIYDGFEDQKYGIALAEAVHQKLDSVGSRLPSQFMMDPRNNKGFSIGIHAGYRLDLNRSGIGKHMYVRNPR